MEVGGVLPTAVTLSQPTIPQHIISDADLKKPLNQYCDDYCSSNDGVYILFWSNFLFYSFTRTFSNQKS